MKHKNKYDDKKGNPAYLSEWYFEQVKYPLHESMIESGEWIAGMDKKGDAVLFNSAWVYVFYNYHTGLYKIGITECIEQRLMTLNSQSGCIIDSVICIDLEPGYDEKKEVVEKDLHLFFSDKRKSGEWFDLGIRDLVAIRKLFWQIEGQDIVDYITDVETYKKEYAKN